MRLQTNWHATWTPWVEYWDRQFGAYTSRRRQLFCGKLLIGTLVNTTNPRHKYPFFMYAGNMGSERTLVRGKSVFRTVREFARRQLMVV
jgi:hypothetical protein